MAKGKSRNQAKERMWRGHVRAQEAGGGSVRGYCRGHGLSEAGFYWWRQELARRAGELGEVKRGGRAVRSVRPPGERGCGAAVRRATKRPGPGFSEVKVVGDEPSIFSCSPESRDLDASVSASIEVCLAGGRTIRVGRQFDGAAFLRIVALLEGGRRC
jgi:hypothetical protein